MPTMAPDALVPKGTPCCGLLRTIRIIIGVILFFVHVTFLFAHFTGWSKVAKSSEVQESWEFRPQGPAKLELRLDGKHTQTGEDDNLHLYVKDSIQMQALAGAYSVDPLAASDESMGFVEGKKKLMDLETDINDSGKGSLNPQKLVDVVDDIEVVLLEEAVMHQPTAPLDATHSMMSSTTTRPAREGDASDYDRDALDIEEPSSDAATKHPGANSHGETGLARTTEDREVDSEGKRRIFGLQSVALTASNSAFDKLVVQRVAEWVLNTTPGTSAMSLPTMDSSTRTPTMDHVQAHYDNL